MKTNINKIELIKDLCSLVIYKVVYNKGFLRKSKTANIKIWYTKTKIHLMEISNDKGCIIDKKINIDFNFKIGDSISDIFLWANENNYTEYYITTKGKGNRTF